MFNPKQNLRTFDNYANIIFKADPDFDETKIVQINPLVRTKKTLFILENILTANECEQLIIKSDPHYMKLDSEYLLTERDGQRVLSNDKKFADVLYMRIQKYLPNKNLQPCGFGVSGKWTPLKINSCFRYCKYIGPSLGFAPHRDATYIENETTRSILTILIYLNDEYQRGSTIFYKTNNKRTMDQTVSDEMKNGFMERFNYKPKKGSVLIFNHNMIHKGDAIMPNDVKYMIRSDIVFACERYDDYNYDWQQNPNFIRCIELYREAFNQELDGNKEKASYLYQRALAIRQCHKE